jgi:hypothetical protein
MFDTLCEHHRPMVDAYLAENPDAWSEPPDPVDPDAEESKP